MRIPMVYNRINQLFENKKESILSIYYTAGFPELGDTVPTLQALQAAGADLVEIGMPFSDPIADGSTIQESNQTALRNGMNLRTLFAQLEGIRSHIQLPLVLMGYVNPVMQYGVEAFCKQCQALEIDGLILPDLPMQAYLEEYKPIFDRHGLHNIFLVTPQTSEARIREIDTHTEGFIYMVSSASVTGAKAGISQAQIDYFERMQALKLRNPRLIGFGISNHETFGRACQYASGAIIGSAFIRLLEETPSANRNATIHAFVEKIRGKNVEIVLK